MVPLWAPSLRSHLSLTPTTKCTNLRALPHTFLFFCKKAPSPVFQALSVAIRGMTLLQWVYCLQPYTLRGLGHVDTMGLFFFFLLKRRDSGGCATRASERASERADHTRCPFPLQHHERSRRHSTKSLCTHDAPTHCTP